MAKRTDILAGATDQTVDVFIQDSSVTTGAGLTGLVYNTASLVCYYRKGATGTPTALTLATQTVGGAHSDGGFVAVDGTNCPGQYRLDLSDTIVATAGMVTVYLRGASNMAPCILELEIQPATGKKADIVSFGGTAGTFSAGRPEVNTTHAAGTAWGSGAITAGSLASDAITAAKIADGAIDAATFATDALARFGVIASGTMQAGSTSTTAVLAAALAYADDIVIGATILITGGTGSGQARMITDYVGASDTATVDTWTTTPDNTSTYVLFATAPSAASSIPPTVNQIVDGVWDESTTGHTSSGTFGEQLMAAGAAGDPWTTTLPASYTGSQAGKMLSDILIDTAEIGAAGAGLTNINLPNQTMDIVGNITGNLSGSVGSVTGNVTGSIGSLATQAKADVNTEVVDALTVDVVADSIPADGSRPTIGQALYMLVQFMTEQSKSGTTVTVRKPDGSTTLMTLTLDSSTSPTSITRAT